MKDESWRTEWHPVTNTEAHQITGCTSSPGVVYPYETTALPSQMQQLSGIYEAYVSGYCSTSQSPEGVDMLGEVIAARIDKGTGKAYVWVFGVSGSGIYFNGPYRPYPEHHYSTADGVPIDDLFGRVPSPSNSATTK